MNKSFLVCLLSAVSVLFAGNRNNQNVSFSYGLFNLTGVEVITRNSIARSFGSDDEEKITFLTISSFNVAYGYELLEKLEIGGILTYSYTDSENSYNSITLMPKTKFNWINKSDFRLYSLLAIGPIFGFNSKNFETATTWQISFIGFEFGRHSSFFFEFGLGQTGSFSTGVKFEL